MRENDKARCLVRICLLSIVVDLYVGCATPIFADGVSVFNVLASLCMAILASYLLTRLHPYVPWFEKVMTPVISKLLAIGRDNA
jgi:hypothetical protein